VAESSVLTIEEAAADLRITPARVWRYHREGRLALLYLAGTATHGRRGAKDGRVDRAEWDRFKRSLMVSVRPEPAPAPPPPRRGRPVSAPPGDDGLTAGARWLEKARRNGAR
jgi:hypothetical protein